MHRENHGWRWPPAEDNEPQALLEDRRFGRQVEMLGVRCGVGAGRSEGAGGARGVAVGIDDIKLIREN